jgi:hypothetical protein
MLARVIGIAGADVRDVIQISPEESHCSGIRRFLIFVKACDRFWQSDTCFVEPIECCSSWTT